MPSSPPAAVALDSDARADGDTAGAGRHAAGQYCSATPVTACCCEPDVCRTCRQCRLSTRRRHHHCKQRRRQCDPERTSRESSRASLRSANAPAHGHRSFWPMSARASIGDSARVDHVARFSIIHAPSEARADKPNPQARSRHRFSRRRVQAGLPATDRIASPAAEHPPHPWA